ncbi:uncharacterized protein LOC119723204 [Patiria miniata]|uniref:Uncharacterized protein n=1 Tax=Patiria miniata TaxID=46514 RepID=A0A913ZD37_PATMI|nr:uncharacterized protein LOC119723204 [Patiria miniata]
MLHILILRLILIVEVSGQVFHRNDWDVRLSGGPHGYEGRLEIRPPNDVWGTVCDKNISVLAIACRSSVALGVCLRLGYLAPYSLSFAGERFDRADLPIWSQGFVCTEQDDQNNISCSLATWNRHPSSCDHSSDVALICISDNLRLAGGCSPREGRVELNVGSAGWVGLSGRQHQNESHVEADLHQADLICKHLGYPIALGLHGTCTNGTADPTLPTIEADTCGPRESSLSACLKSALKSGCEKGTLSHRGRPIEVVCAYDNEIVVSTNSILHRLDFDVRLADGPSRLVGLVEMQYNETGWGPACLYEEPVLIIDFLATAVCKRIGSECSIEFNLVSPDDDPSRGAGIEYLLREGPDSQRHWLRLNEKCRQLGGRYLNVACSLDITSHGVTVNAFPNQTCIGRCGESSSPVQCGCDAMCHTFQDCCYDVTSECPTSTEGEGRNLTGQDLGLTSLLDSSQFYQCLRVSSNQSSAYHLVSRCPDSWAADDVITSQCHLSSNVYPVLYQPLGVPFKNVECAYCHGAAVPPGDGIAGTDALGDSLVPIPASGYDSTLRPCTSLVSTCLSTKAFFACMAYMAPDTKYKNPHCGLCNEFPAYRGVCYKNGRITSLQVMLKGEVPIISPIKPQPVYYVSDRVDPAKFRKGRHEVSLGVTTRIGALETFWNSSSGIDSATCLLNRIAYSDLKLALHFPSSVLDWDFVKETNVVTIATWSLEYTGQLEEELDDILIQDGYPSGVNWADRCGLAQVLLIEKSDLENPAQTTNKSSSESTECYEIDQMNSTLVNISEEIFVYVVPVGALIRPANATITIRYGTQAERTEKFKLFRYCGTRANSITCETRDENNENGRNPDLPDVTLPSGEKLVCFSDNLILTKQDRVSFEDPAQVLNVVGFSLSMAGLMATLVTYSVFPTLRNVPGLAIMSLSLAILVGQLSAILSTVVVDPANEAICTAVAVTSHYVWLAVFAWMAAMSWDLMRTFTSTTSAMTAGGKGRFLRLSLFGWGAPMLIVIPNLALHFCDCTRLVFRYGGRLACWLAGRGSSLLMFCVPIVLCICFNVGCFAWTIRGIRASKKASTMVSRNTSRVQAVWQELVVYAKISSLMSFAWILGFVAVATELTVFWYLFIIFCSLQGVFVFLAFAFSRQVRALWREKLSRPAGTAGSGTSTMCKPSSHVMKTTTGNTGTMV